MYRGRFHRTVLVFMALLALAGILAACGGAAAPTGGTQATAAPAAGGGEATAAPAAGGGEATAAPAAGGGAQSVGIVLPTKDEPRWIQDETRFKDALTKAGYQAEILFSQGDSAKEKA